jgi:tetratricopeptide (TPR) repeat protein
MSEDSSAHNGPIMDRFARQEKRAECFLLLGVECENTDDHETAAKLYRLGIEFGPTEIGTWYFLHNNLGYCLNRLGLHDEAERMCLTAIRVDPGRFNAYKNLGMARRGQGRYPEAAAQFIKAAFIYPPDLRSIGHLQEILANHREEVEREIPDITGHLAAAIDARQKLMQ